MEKVIPIGESPQNKRLLNLFPRSYSVQLSRMQVQTPVGNGVTHHNVVSITQYLDNIFWKLILCVALVKSLQFVLH